MAYYPATNDNEIEVAQRFTFPIALH
jgi:hypothetical protein